MSWHEYTVASLDLTEESPIPGSRPYRQGRLSLDGSTIFVRFIRDEEPWANPITTLTAGEARTRLSSEDYTVPPTFEELAADVAAGINRDRVQHVEAGVLWSDGTDTFFFTSDVDSRMNIDACQTAVNAGIRGDTGVWKCGQLVDGEFEVAYPDMSDTQITEVAGLILGHVQKCFNAEAAAMGKLKTGDLEADFQTEFDLL